MRHRIAGSVRTAALALLALPAAGVAHPGHEHAGLVGGVLHHLLELALIVGVAGIAVAVAGLRRPGRAPAPERRDD